MCCVGERAGGELVRPDYHSSVERWTGEKSRRRRRRTGWSCQLISLTALHSSTATPEKLHSPALHCRPLSDIGPPAPLNFAAPTDSQLQIK